MIEYGEHSEYPEDFPVYTERTLPKEGAFSLSFKYKDASHFQSIFINYNGRHFGLVELYRKSEQNGASYFSTVWPTNIDPLTGKVIIASSYIRLRNHFCLPDYDPKQYKEKFESITDNKIIEPVTFTLSPVKNNENTSSDDGHSNFEPLMGGLSLEKDEDRDKAIFLVLTEQLPPFRWLRFGTLFGDYYFDALDPFDTYLREEREFGFIGTAKSINELVNLHAQTATLQLDSEKDYKSLFKLYNRLLAPIPDHKEIKAE